MRDELTPDALEFWGAVESSLEFLSGLSPLWRQRFEQAIWAELVQSKPILTRRLWQQWLRDWHRP